MKTKASNSTAWSERTECEMDRELITKTEDFLKQKYDSGLYLSENPDARTYRLDFYISFCEKLESQLRSSYSILD